jgi:hypothetical protein
VTGLGSATYISSTQLLSTTFGLERYISTFIDPTELASTVLSTVTGIGLQSNLTSTVTGLGTTGYVSSASLASTTRFFQTAGFVSAPNLLNLVSTIFLFQTLTTLVNGLGTNGYVSTPSLTSTVAGLGTASYISTTAMGAAFSSFSTSMGTVGGGTLNTSNLTSTVTGLGSIGYVSSSWLNSTVAGLGQASYISTLQLRSTVAGLGQSGYVSTTAMGAFFSSLSTSYRNQFNTVTSVISALTVSSLTFGTGDGFLAMPDIRPTAVSTLVTQTSSLQAFNLQIGATSTVTAIQFYGLLGNFNNTVVAERSIAAGAQELLLFKGSSTADQVRIQTTGIFQVETGVSSRLWSTVTEPAVPSFVIDTNSNVGIQTGTPGATLDVAGTGRFQIVSTLQLNVSSFIGPSLVQTSNLVSTVAGLATTGYISTLSLRSTVTGLGTTGYISSFFQVSSISAQQLVASSIFATLAGPTTVVLYEV